MRRLMNAKLLSFTAATLITASTVTAAIVTVLPRTWPRAWENIDDTLIDITAGMGMKLDAMTVEGRGMTAPGDLLAAIDAERGAPILSIDVAEARAHIEALPWVKSAKVERRLPASVHVVITERTPYALWQQAGRYTLVDRDGKAIVDVPDADPALPLIVGPDAPANAGALFEALSVEPDLAARVRAAVRVGERRWNIYLDAFEGGIAIRMPEDDIAAAWTRLVGLEREHKILERDLDFIDLRLADRLVVRVHKEAATETPAPPQTQKNETQKKNPAQEKTGTGKSI